MLVQKEVLSLHLSDDDLQNNTIMKLLIIYYPLDNKPSDTLMNFTVSRRKIFREIIQPCSNILVAIALPYLITDLNSYNYDLNVICSECQHYYLYKTNSLGHFSYLMAGWSSTT